MAACKVIFKIIRLILKPFVLILQMFPWRNRDDCWLRYRCIACDIQRVWIDDGTGAGFQLLFNVHMRSLSWRYSYNITGLGAERDWDVERITNESIDKGRYV